MSHMHGDPAWDRTIAAEPPIGRSEPMHCPNGECDESSTTVHLGEQDDGPPRDDSRCVQCRAALALGKAPKRWQWDEAVSAIDRVHEFLHPDIFQRMWHNVACLLRDYA